MHKVKEFCNKLMMISPALPYGEDYSSIALVLFLFESGIEQGKDYSIASYAHYLYRFYSDIRQAREMHYYRIINAIWHYAPSDLINYSRGVLEYVEKNTGLIRVGSSSFVVEDCPIVNDENIRVFRSIAQALVSKFIDPMYKMYDSRLREEEYRGVEYCSLENRLFYRALENINYCFISDETNHSNLYAIRLTNKDDYDSTNYIVLSKEYAVKYLDKSLIIKKNGYPYLNGERLYQHLEISVLKRIRNNLE